MPFLIFVLHSHQPLQQDYILYAKGARSSLTLIYICTCIHLLDKTPKHAHCTSIFMCIVGVGIGYSTGDQHPMKHGSSQSVSVCLTINCCHVTVQSACGCAEQLAGRKGHYWECKQPIASAINGRGL